MWTNSPACLLVPFFFPSETCFKLDQLLSWLRCHLQSPFSILLIIPSSLSWIPSLPCSSLSWLALVLNEHIFHLPEKECAGGSGNSELTRLHKLHPWKALVKNKAWQDEESTDNHQRDSGTLEELPGSSLSYSGHTLSMGHEPLKYGKITLASRNCCLTGEESFISLWSRSQSQTVGPDSMREVMIAIDSRYK